MSSPLFQLVRSAFQKGASDIHLESGSSAVFRINSRLQPFGEKVSLQQLKTWTTELLGARYSLLSEEGSIDFSESIGGIRCRLHIFFSSRGLAYAIRLLSAAQPSFASLNLHPNFDKLLHNKHGLIIFSGSTGSGKSSSIAALINEINQRYAYNIVTMEQPIEYYFQSKMSFIRQREIGRDAPTFEKALLDSLRQDPDVLLLGEMRDPATMQGTLYAAESGHLVLTTMHASTVSDCLNRLVSAFPADLQSHVCAQLADCLIAVICQKLSYQERIGLRVPVCEMFFMSTAGRSKIRQGEFTSIPDTYYAGRDIGCMTESWYQQWLDQKTDFYRPELPSSVKAEAKAASADDELLQSMRWKSQAQARSKASRSQETADSQYTIDSDDDDELWEIIENLEKPPQ